MKAKFGLVAADQPVEDAEVGLRRLALEAPEVIRASGATSLGAIASELNARGMLTRRGGRWHKSTVKNLLVRLDTTGTETA